MKFNKRSDVFVDHDPFFKDEIWRVVSIILTFKSTKRAPTNPCPFDSLQIKQATKPELPGVGIWRRARSPSFEGHSVASISVCYVSGCHGLPLCSLKFWTTFTTVLQHSNSALEPHGCMNRAAVVQAASCLGSSGFQGRKTHHQPSSFQRRNQNWSNLGCCIVGFYPQSHDGMHLLPALPNRVFSTNGVTVTTVCFQPVGDEEPWTLLS